MEYDGGGGADYLIEAPASGWKPTSPNPPPNLRSNLRSGERLNLNLKFADFRR